jgi:hypothetical protein
MRTELRLIFGIAAAIVLVVVGLGAGWVLFGRWLWAPGMMGGPAMSWNGAGCSETGLGWGRMGQGSGSGMMYGGPGLAGDPDCAVVDTDSTPVADAIDIEEAQDAVIAYLQNLGYRDLEIAELMEFEHNFYAIVREHDTGVGAMELLVDKTSGAVGPEMGPNMMWNTRYGMHQRGAMMGWGRTANTVSEEEAVQVAQRWLDANRPGAVTEGHADRFYGYYTIHTLRDGEIEGMLSVHGATGQVWYHSWHGAFVQMIEMEDEHL